MTDPMQTAEAEGQTAVTTETGPIDHATLPIVPAGEPLVDHEVYLDVANLGHGPFRALEGQTAASGNGYVAEKDVDPAIWDQLLREDGEARLLLDASTNEHHTTATTELLRD